MDINGGEKAVKTFIGRFIVMKKNGLFCFLCLLLLFATVSVHGQGFNGPGTGDQPVMVSQSVTISEAKNYPHDSWVVITGNIVNALPGGTYFTFRDSSEEIPVEIGPKEWRGFSVWRVFSGVSDTVEISGEVKKERGQVFIKVHAITSALEPKVSGTSVRQYAVTINEARNLSHDSWVILTGNIVHSLPQPNDYTFRDSSGEITIDIGPKEWRGLSAAASDTVEICGEVKKERGQVFIKVHAIRKI
jgi:uncharacterized protein (TIGR00156 family)